MNREEHTRPAPKIQFVGIFDTVKAVNDQSLYDISFNGPIQHLRHALALNEDRAVMSPEPVLPRYDNVSSRRSIQQAWFIGAHIDMGGSSAKDGLALYPLQWMLIESQSKGLKLEFTGSYGGRAQLDNPLEIVLPSLTNPGKEIKIHSYTAKNKIVVSMQDMRKVHGSERFGTRYAIHVNRKNSIWMTKKVRKPFNSGGGLIGYHEFGLFFIVYLAHKS